VVAAERTEQGGAAAAVLSLSGALVVVHLPASERAADVHETRPVTRLPALWLRLSCEARNLQTMEITRPVQVGRGRGPIPMMHRTGPCWRVPRTKHRVLDVQRPGAVVRRVVNRPGPP
jgi:hypothetical protein